MNQDTREIIERSAPLIYHLYQQPAHVQSGLRAPYSTAIQILQALEEGGTVEALGERLNLHSNTVFEYLGALEKGGVNIHKRGQKKSDHRFEDGRPNSYFYIDVSLKITNRCHTPI